MREVMRATVRRVVADVVCPGESRPMLPARYARGPPGRQTGSDAGEGGLEGDDDHLGPVAGSELLHHAAHVLLRGARAVGAGAGSPLVRRPVHLRGELTMIHLGHTS